MSPDSERTSSIIVWSFRIVYPCEAKVASLL
jgi:hypothetical protein